MSLLMEALRRAEQANKVPDGTPCPAAEAGSSALPDLSEVEDIELGDLSKPARTAAVPGTDGATPGAAQMAGATQAAAGEQRYLQTPACEAAPGMLAGVSLELQLEPLGPSPEARAQAALPLTVAASSAATAQSLEPSAGAVLEAPSRDLHTQSAPPRELDAAARSPHTTHAAPSPATGTKAHAEPRPAREAMGAAQRSAQPPATAAAPASEPAPSPVRAAAVLAAASRPAAPRARALLIGGAALIVATFAGGGAFVYYEQHRLAVPLANVPAFSTEPLASVPAALVENPPGDGATLSLGDAASPLPPHERVPLPQDAAPADAHVGAQSAPLASAPAAAVPQPKLPAPVPERVAVAMVDLPAAKPPLADEALAASPDAQTAPSRVTPTRQTAAAAPEWVIGKAPQEDLLHRVLLNAYDAYQRGDNTSAQRLYEQVLQSEPGNRDALLGLAAVYSRYGAADRAQALYGQVLRDAPGDIAAAIGLLTLMAQSDPLRSESEAKYWLTREPNTAALHFVLGNVYVQQARWADAQQAFFNAVRLDNRNADYAFNLAVSLDQLGQHKQAVSYYQAALQLAGNGSGSFDLAALNQRLHKLEQQIARGSAP
jgi:tetratricopeptide (TPR) repeat protein